MWKPKHPAFKNFAENISNYYLERIEKGETSRQAVTSTANFFSMSDVQVYRYLAFTNTPRPTRTYKRSNGRFSK